MTQTALDGLVLSELPEPLAGPGEVLVCLQTAALNHRDLGMFDWEPDAHFVMGADGAGVIEALGPAVETLFWHQLNLLGSTMGSPRDSAAVLEMVSAAGLRPVSDSIWFLAEGRRALQHLAQGRQFGEAVLQTA